MRLTKIIIAACLAALVGRQIYALNNKEEGDLVSNAIWDWTDGFTPGVFAIGLVNGILIGHWFWPRTVIQKLVQYVETQNIEETK